LWFGAGVAPGDGTDMEELKDWVMSEMMWDPTLDPDVLIAEFLAGYYGKAAPFVRLYMDTMHAAVDETDHFLRSCCVQPPAGIEKSFLTPMALLTSATAFKVFRNVFVQFLYENDRFANTGSGQT
jgi:hypothetical protein